jgi:hypothetical protein
MKHIFIPHYEGLSIECILDQCKTWPHIFKWLPHEKDLPKVPKQWLCNVIFTVIGEPFSDFVQAKIEERNAKRASTGAGLIELDPEIAAAFNQSTSIGVSHLTLITLLVCRSKKAQAPICSV